MGKLAKMPRTTPTTGTLSMSLGALVFAETALGNLCALKLPAQVAYRLSKLARVVADETKHYHESRTAIIRELGTKDGRDFGIPNEIDGQPNPKIEEFQRRMIDIANVTVELQTAPIGVSDLGDHAISAGDMLALGPLLADPETKGQS